MFSDLHFGTELLISLVPQPSENTSLEYIISSHLTTQDNISCNNELFLQILLIFWHIPADIMQCWSWTHARFWRPSFRWTKGINPNYADGPEDNTLSAVPHEEKHIAGSHLRCFLYYITFSVFFWGMQIIQLYNYIIRQPSMSCNTFESDKNIKYKQI